MIDPSVPDMGGLRTETDRQEFLLFCIAVAGKESGRTQAALNMLLIDLIKSVPTTSAPFPMILYAAREGWLRRMLERSKIGQYDRIEKAFIEVADRFNGRVGKPEPLAQVTVRELEEVHGIGPKTARYFVQYAQGRKDVAALDTHLLKWLRDLGYDAPKNTPPSGARYRTLEAAFLYECAHRGMDPQEMDFKVWSTYKHGGKVA